MAQPPHLAHTVSSCRTQLEQSSNSLTVATVAPNRSPSPISSYLKARLCLVSPPQDSQAISYALGTLKYRRQKNRKRTRTGEFVWSDETDLMFTLALINWTSNRTYRLGSRRANFLQHFLARNGYLKTRKQIASRLQVLKGEWKATSYLNLLDDPERSGAKQAHVASSSPSIPSVQDPVSTPSSFTSSASSASPTVVSQSLHFGNEHAASVDATPDEKPDLASLPMALPLPPIDEDDKYALRRLLQLDDNDSQARGQMLGLVRDNYTAPAAPQVVVTHHLALHAPTAVVPGHIPSQYPLPRPANHAPDFFASQQSRYYPHPSCVQCEPQNSALGGLFYQPRPPFAY